MKTIIYSIIAIIFFSIVSTRFTREATSKHRILIQCTDKNVTAVLLSQSAKIISDRLKEFSSEKFTLTVIPERNQIRVVLGAIRDLKATENLLTQKGTLAFYETYNQKSLADLLQGDTHLFSLLNSDKTTDYGAKIGCSSASEVNQIKDYLHSLGLDQKCKFVWDQNPDGTGECLYALKINGKKGALLVKSDLEKVQISQNDSSKINGIEIRLKESAVALWAEATKRNMGHAIAVVLDNHILAAPIVRSVISGGKCTISGNFTQPEARSIASLANSGELPLNFRVVK